MTDDLKAALDLQEQVARINREMADIERKRQERELAPKHFTLTIVTTVAIAFAAGGTFAAGIAALIKVYHP